MYNNVDQLLFNVFFLKEDTWLYICFLFTSENYTKPVDRSRWRSSGLENISVVVDDENKLKDNLVSSQLGCYSPSLGHQSYW